MKTIKKLGQAVAVATLGMSVSLAASADTINIGFTGPLSGGAAFYGENTLSGLRMAADEINANGGITVNGEKHTLNIIALDDRYSPAQAATNAKRLKQESNVPVVFIPHAGGIFAAMDFNEDDDFLVMAYTSVPTVTTQGNELLLRIPPTFDGYVQAFTKYAQETYGTNLGMGGATHEYARIWADMVKKEWTDKGGEIVADNAMDYNQSADFFTGVSRIVSRNPDVMFVGGASEPTGLVIQQARQVGYEGAFMIMDQAKIDEVAEVAGGMELMEDSVGVMPLSADESEAAQSFLKRYNERTGKVAGSEAAYHYLSMHTIADAIEAAGSTEPADIRAAVPAALAALDDSKNPYDIREVTPDGGFVTPLVIAVVQDGKVIEVDPYE